MKIHNLIAKELARVSREEEKRQRQAEKAGLPWKKALEEKIPEKLYGELQKVFYRAFALIFEKGAFFIEKTYQREELEKDFQVHNFALELKGSRRELRRMEAAAAQSHWLGLAASTVEGVGLGALGIGLPDIVLFVSAILRGVYETALRYGFSYDTPEERYFILVLLEGAMRRGSEWRACSTRLDGMLTAPFSAPEDAAFDTQLRATADAFALDMLLAKFIQGLPIVGIAGGLMNPLTYSRVLGYVQLKYKKRFLLRKQQAAD